MLMRRYLEAWGDRAAYAVSHVGWGLNPRARYEALSMYDQRDTNGTELRAVAGDRGSESVGVGDAVGFEVDDFGAHNTTSGVAIITSSPIIPICSARPPP